MEIIWFFAIIFVSLLTIYILLQITDTKYFFDRRIHYLGNMNYTMIFYNLSLAENTLFWYQKAKRRNLKIAGVKDLLSNTIIVIDPELIKKIMVQDFEHFVDHRPFNLSNRDYILKGFLPFANGEHWRSLRNKITPIFTTGKVRRMFKIFNTSSKKLLSYLEQKMTEDSSQIDLSEGFNKFTVDVIASAAFGIESRAFDQEGNSQFQTMGEKLQIKFQGLQILKFLMMEVLPKKISHFLRLSAFPLDAQNYFSQLVKSVINYRTKSGEERDDFMQIMLEATEREKKNEIEAQKKDSNKFTFTDEDITTQSVTLILAGLEGTDATLRFMIYSLALHPDVQNRLRQELITSLEDTGGEFSYESVNQMEYLDMILTETLRLYAPVTITNRACTKDYMISDSDVMIKKGDILVIPIFGIQRCPDNFEHPERFDPERWTAENRSKIHPYAYLPFGHGSRNCIGMRFSTIAVKLAIANLIYNFDVASCEKTSIPIKFGSSLTLKPREGMWLKLIKRM